jgi:hypothetical protein
LLKRRREKYHDYELWLSNRVIFIFTSVKIELFRWYLNSRIG